jgi:cell division protein FtsI/penicillin-binding protein 2
VDRLSGRTLYEKSPELAQTANIDPEHLKFLRATMEKVISSDQGTGKKARVAGVRVAGKTGTSENPHGDNHAWFTCYAPADEPRIAIIAMVENGGEGGIVSAPIAKRLMELELGQEVTPWQTPTPGAAQVKPAEAPTPVTGVAP